VINLCGEILSSREKATKEIACVNENFAVFKSHVQRRKSKRKEEKSERELDRKAVRGGGASFFVSSGRVSTSIIIIVALNFSIFCLSASITNTQKKNSPTLVISALL
jgi:hypothetical protein